MDGKWLEKITREQLDQLEKDLERCEHSVSKEILREAIETRQSTLHYLNNNVTKSLHLKRNPETH